MDKQYDKLLLCFWPTFGSAICANCFYTKKKNNFHRRIALRGCTRVASFVCHLWQPLILHFCFTIRVYSLCGMTSTSVLLHSLTGIFVAKLIAQIVLNVLLRAASCEFRARQTTRVLIEWPFVFSPDRMRFCAFDPLKCKSKIHTHRHTRNCEKKKATAIAIDAING